MVVDGVVVIEVVPVKGDPLEVEVMQLQTLDLAVEEQILIMIQVPQVVLVDLVSF